jgi:hypothetical protein
VEWRGCILVEHGWDDFAEHNSIAQGDTLYFTYIVESSMDVAIPGSNVYKKILPATNPLAPRH